MIAIELTGILCFGLALGLLYLARPRNGVKPAFLKNDSMEILYSLLVLFAFSGGITAMILGFV